MEDTLTAPVPTEAPKRGSIIDDIRDTVTSIDYKGIVTSQYFIPGLLVVVGIFLGFWPLIAQLPERWSRDEYYSHGFAVPFIIAFIVYKKWPVLKTLKVESGFASPVQTLVGVIFTALTAIVLGGYLYVAYSKLDALGIAIWMSTVLFVGSPIIWLAKKAINAVAPVDKNPAVRVTASILLGGMLALFLFATFISVSGSFWNFSSVFLIISICLALWAILGARIAAYLILPVAYLIFALPVWGSLIDGYTNPLQLMSTKVAFGILKALQMNPFQSDPTIIRLNQFTLDVGIPCSGMKLMLAVSAFTALFTMIGELKLWANQLMFAIALPFCLFINGLRISLIGVVGDMYGAEAGHQFHDYSGYITVVLCFVLLLRFARILGWKG